MVSFFSFFFTFVCALVSMAFYTLFERKFLGHAQVRKGPNKVGFLGLLQPFSDAMKLFLKQVATPESSNSAGFYIAPTLSLCLALVMWMFYPFTHSAYYFTCSLLFFMVISSVSVYCTIAAGWASNSKYALLGVMRSVAQTISYEISMAIFLLSCIVLMSGVSFQGMLYSSSVWVCLLFPPLFFVWLVTLLAETNRAPFDFAEGESELVSGFNVEYAAGPFAFIFMAEYTNILAMSVLTVVLFLPFSLVWGLSPLVSVMSFLVVSASVVWARAALPRMRYDCLMMLSWKSFLPLSLGIFCLFFCVFSALA